MLVADWLKERPFTLTLSSGFFGFFAHAGLVCALEEANIFPEKITGSSAGALIGACWASGLSAHEIRDHLLRIEKKDFWDPCPGFGLLRGSLFREVLDGILPIKVFSECRFTLNLSVYNIIRRKTETLNSGEINPAIRASCAVPFLFHPVKVNRSYYLDGGIHDRPALTGIDHRDRVFYHHLEPRSFWRGRFGLDVSRPARDEMVSLMLTGLPRVGPNKLDQGKKAYAMAYKKTQFILKEHQVSSLINF